jgi:hypothetical protein
MIEDVFDCGRQTERSFDRFFDIEFPESFAALPLDPQRARANRLGENKARTSPARQEAFLLTDVTSG